MDSRVIAKRLRCWHFHVAEGPSAAIARAAAPPAADAATESTSGPEDSFMLQQSAGMFTFQNFLDTVVIYVCFKSLRVGIPCHLFAKVAEASQALAQAEPNEAEFTPAAVPTNVGKAILGKSHANPLCSPV